MPKRGAGIGWDKRRGSWVARLTYRDGDGKRIDRKTYCRTQTEARKALAHLQAEAATFRSTGARPWEARTHTLEDLFDYYEAEFLKVARWEVQEHENRAVRRGRGLSPKNLKTVRSHLKMIRTYFAEHGPRLLSKLTPEHLAKFKAARLDTPTRHGTPRAIASVHRELALISKMLRTAVKLKWLSHSPWEEGLIALSQERSREVILSAEHERRLLEAADAQPGWYPLRSAIVVTVETGLRFGELMQLEWRDLDLESRRLTVRPETSKSRKGRSVPLPDRAIAELREVRGKRRVDPGELVFGAETTCKRKFLAARKAAGLEQVRWHDLRHCYGSRLAAAGVNSAFIQSALGHSQPSMTSRYINADVTSDALLVTALNGFRQQVEISDANVN